MLQRTPMENVCSKGVSFGDLNSPDINNPNKTPKIRFREFISSVTGGVSISVGSNDLEWPWKARREKSNFQADLLNNARNFLYPEPPNYAG